MTAADQKPVEFIRVYDYFQISSYRIYLPRLFHFVTFHLQKTCLFALFSRLAYASVVIMTFGLPAGHLSSCRSAKVDIVFFTLRSFLFLRSTSSPTTFSSNLIKPCYNLLRADRLKERRMERQKSAKERRKALESKMALWNNSDQLEHSQGRD